MSGQVYDESEEGVMAGRVDAVADLETGATYAEGEMVATDGESLVAGGFAELNVPGEVPDAVGGFEADAAGELEGADEEG